MPKRRNPFGECSPLQLKQHVGKKEVDLGVAQQQNMISVYARTRELLFSGSKKSFSTETDANCNNIYKPFTPENLEVPMDSEESIDSCQMRISSTGQLVTENNNVKAKNAFHQLFMGRKGSSSSGCQCCKGQAASQDRCGFCEKSICQDCVRSCTACQSHFCQLCSVMNYEDSSERAYCLQCAS